MNYFEQWFLISPDGGSGVLEALYAMAPVAVIAVIAFWRSFRRKRSA